jgi:hypothetical protein
VNEAADRCAVDALKVDGGDAKVGVPELALDDVERHALASHLDGVCVSELMRGKAPANASFDGGVAKLGPHC